MSENKESKDVVAPVTVSSISNDAMNSHTLVLGEEEQRALNEKKVELRIANEKYLRDHPELQRLVEGFIAEVLQSRPNNVELFAGQFFTKDNLKGYLESTYMTTREREILKEESKINEEKK